MPQETPPAQLDDVIVTGTRRAPESSDVSWLRDFFGFDSGRFLLSDFGIGSSSHTVITGGGFGVALPNGDERPLVGVNVGLDVNPADGDVGVSVAPGITVGNPEPGPYVDGLSAGYWATVPYVSGGLAWYPLPGGDPTEGYWGPPPGSAVGPFPDFE